MPYQRGQLWVVQNASNGNLLTSEFWGGRSLRYWYGPKAKIPKITSKVRNSSHGIPAPHKLIHLTIHAPTSLRLDSQRNLSINTRNIQNSQEFRIRTVCQATRFESRLFYVDWFSFITVIIVECFDRKCFTPKRASLSHVNVDDDGCLFWCSWITNRTQQSGIGRENEAKCMKRLFLSFCMTYFSIADCQ